MATLITATPRANLEALRHQGILITESYVQIKSLLERSLSPEHALFFAEPAHENSGTSIDWYTDAQGTLTKLDNLPAQEQVAAKNTISRLAGDIRKLAEELTQTGDASKVIRGNILLQALEYPATEYLYMAGNQPVLTCWGFHAAGAGVVPEDLVRLGAAVPIATATPETPSSATVETPPPVAAVHRSSWGWLRALWYILLGLLLLLAFFFLLGLLAGPSGLSLGGCAVPTITERGAVPPAPGVIPAPEGTSSSGWPRMPYVVNGCTSQHVQTVEFPPEVMERLRADQAREEELRRQIDEARLLLMQRVAECPRPTPEPPVEEPKLEPPVDDAVPDLASLMPSTPETPREPPAPKPQPKPKPEAPQQPKPKKGDVLTIPKGAKEKNDLSFLEGCWTQDSKLYSTTNNEPIVTQYCFNKSGQGQQIIDRKKTKDRCTGSARARFDSSGKLRIDAERAKCTRGGSFVPEIVECTPGSTSTKCYGRTLKGDRKWNAIYRRS